LWAAEDRRAILRDLLDAQPDEEEKDKDKAGPKDKAVPKAKGMAEPKAGPKGLKVAEARKRAADAAKQELNQIKCGEHALVMACEDFDLETEEKRSAKGTPEEPTSWYKDDLSPEAHTPLLCGVVVETVPNKPAWHFGHAKLLPKEHVNIKVSL